MSVASVTLARLFLTTGEPAHGFEFLDDEGRGLPSSKGATMLRMEKRAAGRIVRVRVDVRDLAKLTDVLPAKGLAFITDAISARIEGKR